MSTAQSILVEASRKAMLTAMERKEKRRQRQEQVKAQQDKFARLMSHNDDQGLKVLETEIAHLGRLNTIKSHLD